MARRTLAVPDLSPLDAACRLSGGVDQMVGSHSAVLASGPPLETGCQPAHWTLTVALKSEVMIGKQRANDDPLRRAGCHSA